MIKVANLCFLRCKLLWALQYTMYWYIFDWWISTFGSRIIASTCSLLQMVWFWHYNYWLFCWLACLLFFSLVDSSILHFFSKHISFHICWHINSSSLSFSCSICILWFSLIRFSSKSIFLHFFLFYPWCSINFSISVIYLFISVGSIIFLCFSKKSFIYLPVFPFCLIIYFDASFLTFSSITKISHVSSYAASRSSCSYVMFLQCHFCWMSSSLMFIKSK